MLEGDDACTDSEEGEQLAWNSELMARVCGSKHEGRNRTHRA